MQKTTGYLPEELQNSLQQIARNEGRSKAQIIREAIQHEVDSKKPPNPRVPISERGLGDPSAAQRVDELLEGFGES